MIEIFKRGKEELEPSKNPSAGTWVRYSKPTKEEIKTLNKIASPPSDFLPKIQDVEEIPFVEKSSGQLFALIRIPIKTGQVETPYKTIPLGIIVTKHNFITICYHENEVIPLFKTYNGSLKGLRPLVDVMYAAARVYLTYLKEINKEMYATEKDLQKSTRNKDLLELFELEKSLVFFSTAIANNRVILERISKAISPADKDMYDDTVQEFKQAATMAKIYSITLTIMMDTFGSIISNNLNKVIKALTSITIILMIPTLVASFYGMNVELPFQNHPQAFFITIIISLILIAMGVVFFWRKELF